MTNNNFELDKETWKSMEQFLATVCFYLTSIIDSNYIYLMVSFPRTTKTFPGLPRRLLVLVLHFPSIAAHKKSRAMDQRPGSKVLSPISPQINRCSFIVAQVMPLTRSRAKLPAHHCLGRVFRPSMRRVSMC